MQEEEVKKELKEGRSRFIGGNNAIVTVARSPSPDVSTVDWTGQRDHRHPGAHRCDESVLRIRQGHARADNQPPIAFGDGEWTCAVGSLRRESGDVPTGARRLARKHWAAWKTQVVSKTLESLLRTLIMRGRKW